MKPRVLLAWEGGDGRGHIVTLKIIAEALGDAVIPDAALCRMDHAAEIAAACDGVFPGARLSANRARREAAGNPGAATWGDVLGDLNFWNSDFLITQIGWWLEAIKARQSQMLIADFAPCAQLAARIAGIPIVCVGTGYTVAPSGLDAFPVLLPDYSELVFEEAELLAAVNHALRHFGGQALERLSDIYADATAMPRTIAGLDPYSGLRTEPLPPPLNEKLTRPDGWGDEVFIYFSTNELENEALMAAVAGLDMPRRAYMPGADPLKRLRFAEAGIMVEARPIPADDIGRRSRLVVHSGQHGSLCLGLGMGLPQVAVPQHLEHLFHARRAAELAQVEIIGKNDLGSADIAALIRNAYESESGRKRAEASAEQLRPELFGDIAAIVRERLLPLLG